MASNYDDGGGRNQLHQYVNQLLIQLRESQRDLIQARYIDRQRDYTLRSQLQIDIISVYHTLLPYKNRAEHAWDTVELYRTADGAVTGLDQIREWDRLDETVETESDDFTGGSETRTQPKVMPRNVLVPAATAISKVADNIGFNAVDPNVDEQDQEPF